jgi:hypothetical protein
MTSDTVDKAIWFLLDLLQSLSAMARIKRTDARTLIGRSRYVRLSLCRCKCSFRVKALVHPG